MVPASQIIPQTLSAFVCNRSGPIHFSDSQSDLNTSSKTVYVTTEGAFYTGQWFCVFMIYALTVTLILMGEPPALAS